MKKTIKEGKDYIRFPDGTIIEDSPMNYPSIRRKCAAAIKTWETGEHYVAIKEGNA